MRSRATSQKKPVMIVRIIKTPIWALRKAKDFYVKGINNFSTTYNRPRMIMEDANRATLQLPRSFSTTMLSNDHSRNQPSGGLNRANSTSATQISMADIERNIIQNRTHQLQSSASRKGVPRSCSVGMGRIDEDRVSSFRDDNILFEHKLIVKDNGSRLSRILSHARDTRRF